MYGYFIKSWMDPSLPQPQYIHELGHHRRVRSTTNYSRRLGDNFSWTNSCKSLVMFTFQLCPKRFFRFFLDISPILCICMLVHPLRDNPSSSGPVHCLNPWLTPLQTATINNRKSLHLISMLAMFTMWWQTHWRVLVASQLIYCQHSQLQRPAVCDFSVLQRRLLLDRFEWILFRIWW